MNYFRHQNYKNGHTKKNRHKEQTKSRLLELERDFKPINISIYHMDEFEGKVTKNKRWFARNI